MGKLHLTGRRTHTSSHGVLKSTSCVSTVGDHAGGVGLELRGTHRTLHGMVLILFHLLFQIDQLLVLGCNFPCLLERDVLQNLVGSSSPCSAGGDVAQLLKSAIPKSLLLNFGVWEDDMTWSPISLFVQWGELCATQKVFAGRYDGLWTELGRDPGCINQLWCCWPCSWCQSRL